MDKDELPFIESDARVNFEGYNTNEVENQSVWQIETRRFYEQKARKRYLLNLGALAERAGLRINEQNRLEWKLGTKMQSDAVASNT